jgi:hypothetical protein
MLHVVALHVGRCAQAVARCMPAVYILAVARSPLLVGRCTRGAFHGRAVVCCAVHCSAVEEVPRRVASAMLSTAIPGPT